MNIKMWLAVAGLAAGCAPGGDPSASSNADLVAASVANGSVVTLVAKDSGKCVDVPSSSKASGVQLQQYSCNGTAAQQFTVSEASGSYTFKNVSSGLCLDLKSDLASNGTVIQQFTCNRTAAQQFTLAPVSGATNTYEVKTSHGDCVDVTNQSTANGALLQEWSDDGTTVLFQGSGKFIVNKLFEPAFVIANSSDITLTNWNVEWNASMPVSLDTDGYCLGGVYYPQTNGNGSDQFNDIVLTNWLAANRNIDSAARSHGLLAYWLSSVNISSIFLMVGDTSDVTITGLDLYASNVSQPSTYIPFGFMLGVGYKSNQTVTTATPSRRTRTRARRSPCRPTSRSTT